MVNTELRAPVVGQVARVTERLLLQRPSLHRELGVGVPSRRTHRQPPSLLGAFSVR